MTRAGLSAEEERHVAAVVAAAGRRPGGVPFRLAFHGRRIEIWATGGSGSRDDLRTVRAAGATAFDVRTVVRGLGYEAIARLAPRPSDPQLLATVTVGREAPPTAEENALHVHLAEDAGRTAPPPQGRRESWWAAYEHLVAAANDEGARLKRIGPETTRRLGLETGPDETPVVLTTWGDGPAAWVRAGMAAEKVRLVAAGEGLTVELAAEDVQLRALRERLGDPLAELGWTQIVLLVSPVRWTGDTPGRESRASGRDPGPLADDSAAPASSRRVSP